MGTLLGAVLLACSSGARDEQAPSTSAADTAAPGGAAAPASADAPWQRGTLVRASDGLRFRACAEGSTLTVVDSTGSSLAEAVASLAGDMGDSTYAELRGRVEGSPPATLVATELVRVTPVGEGGGCGRDPFEGHFLARGNEPFWAVAVHADSIVWRAPDEPGLRFPATAPTEETGDRRVWEASVDTPAPHRLRLVLERIPCTDSMSGERMAWRAEATLDGRTVEGCAFEGRSG